MSKNSRLKDKKNKPDLPLKSTREYIWGAWSKQAIEAFDNAIKAYAKVKGIELKEDS